MNFKEKIDFFMNNESIKNLNQLASKSGIPYTTLRDCYDKNNADNSRMSTIRKLAKYMNCTTDYLSYDELEEPKNTLSKEETFSELDNLLFSKAKDLSDDDKIAVMNVIDAIKRKIDNEEN